MFINTANSQHFSTCLDLAEGIGKSTHSPSHNKTACQGFQNETMEAELS